MVKRPPNPLAPPMKPTDDPVLTYQRARSFSVDGRRRMADINVHGCTTGRWSGKGTAKPNKPRSIA